MEDNTEKPQNDKIFWIVFTITWIIVFVGTIIGFKYFK